MLRRYRKNNSSQAFRPLPFLIPYEFYRTSPPLLAVRNRRRPAAASAAAAAAVAKADLAAYSRPPKASELHQGGVVATGRRGQVATMTSCPAAEAEASGIRCRSGVRGDPRSRPSVEARPEDRRNWGLKRRRAGEIVQSQASECCLEKGTSRMQPQETTDVARALRAFRGSSPFSSAWAVLSTSRAACSCPLPPGQACRVRWSRGETPCALAASAVA